MLLTQAVLLFSAATVGAALNAVAGGGSFVTFPSLVFAGVAPVMANATSTMALWPASLASAAAYRKDMRSSRRLLAVLGAASLIGGLVGACLLVRTSDATFAALVPWLLLAASALFTWGGAVTRRLRARVEAAEGGAALVGIALVQLVISVYGGYFGGGMSILMLAALSALGMTNIHAMNGLKTLLGATVNGVAILAFVVAGTIAWRCAAVMIAGALAGGYFGAFFARRVEARLVKRFALTVAWSMTIYFLVKSFGLAPDLAGLRATLTPT